MMERPFLNLKMERVWQRQYSNHDEARRDINQYIVAFYKRVRLHPTLGCSSASCIASLRYGEERPRYFRGCVVLRR